jgi:acetyl esterase/lipase
VQAHAPKFPCRVNRFERERALSDPVLEWREPLHYGTHQEQTVLIARLARRAPESGSPVYVFFHGGHWRAFWPHYYRSLSRAICDIGAIAVLPGYRKMPRHRLAEVVSNVRLGTSAALTAVGRQPVYGNGKRPFGGGAPRLLPC